MEIIKTFPIKVISFLKEVRIEMKKVNWPTKEETTKFTLIVIGVSAAVALFLGSLDYIFRFGLCFMKVKDITSCLGL